MLLGADGRALVDAADALLDHRCAPEAALALAGLMPTADADLRAACLAQAVLRRRARHLGHDLAILSDMGLQQASRPEAARHRARSLTDRVGFCGTVTDLGCGLGVDSRALLNAGWRVRPVEADPWTADAARANTADLGVCVTTGTAEAADLTGLDAAYCDPARRSAAPAGPRGRTPPERDPERWSPPWSWVQHTARQVPTVAKVAPGLPASVIPDGAEAEWVAVGDDVVELVVWFTPLARVGRRATLLDPGSGAVRATVQAPAPTRAVADATDSTPATRTLGPTLIEPHPVVRAADLVEVLADHLDRQRIDPGSEWLTGSAVEHPLARTWQVVEPLPWSAKRLRGALDAHRPGSVTYKTRDVGLSAEALAQRVAVRRHPGGPHLTVVVHRSADGPTPVLVSPS